MSQPWDNLPDDFNPYEWAAQRRIEQEVQATEIPDTIPPEWTL